MKAPDQDEYYFSTDLSVRRPPNQIEGREGKDEPEYTK
jgi:hypothetical protein